MEFTEFYMTQGAGAAPNNGGYPLGPDDGPIYVCTDATVTSGDIYTIIDNTGNDWSGVNVGDWVCWSANNYKQTRRVLSKSGDTITVHHWCNPEANAECRVGGARDTLSSMANLLIMSGASTYWANTLAPPPRVNIKYYETAYPTETAVAQSFGTWSLAYPLTIEGYQNEPGDIDWQSASFDLKPKLVWAAGTNCLTIANYMYLANLDITANDTGLSYGICLTSLAQYATLKNCNLTSMSGNYICNSVSGTLYRCNIERTRTGNYAMIYANAYSRYEYCMIKGRNGNYDYAFQIGSSNVLVNGCIITQCAIILLSSYAVITNNTFVSGTGGIRLGSTSCTIAEIRNNIFANQSGYGIDSTSSKYLYPQIIGNVFYSNSSGSVNTSRIDLPDNSNVTLTESPFYNVLEGDFRLKISSGLGGNGCPKQGVTYPSKLTSGAIQHDADDGVYPSESEVINGTIYGGNQSKTGNLILPDESNVLIDVNFGSDGEYTGNIILPDNTDVRDGVQYGIDGTELQGNLTLPQTSKVRSGETFGANGTEYTGNLVLPAVDDVRSSVVFGSDGEFIGNLIVPIPADVKLETVYGSNGELIGLYRGPTPDSSTQEIELISYSHGDTATLLNDTIAARLLANILYDIDDLKDENWNHYFRQVFAYPTEPTAITPPAVMVYPASITDVSGSFSNVGRDVDYNFKIGIALKYADETDAIKAIFFAVNKIASIFHPNKIYTNLPSGKYVNSGVSINDMQQVDSIENGVNVYDTGLTITCRVSVNW